MQALTSQFPNLPIGLGSFLSILHQLAHDWAVNVEHAQLPACQVGVFDAATRTVQLRADAPFEDQVAFLSDTWFLLAVGPHATRWVRRQPHLQLIPTQRVGS